MSEAVFRIPETIREDTVKFKENLKQFLAADLSAERFKGYRVPMGIYGQRGDFKEEKYMVRVRIPGGFLTEKQFRLLAELSRDYGAGYLHFTTRQDIQLHQIEIDESAEVLRFMQLEEWVISRQWLLSCLILWQKMKFLLWQRQSNVYLTAMVIAITGIRRVCVLSAAVLEKLNLKNYFWNTLSRLKQKLRPVN